MAYHGNKKNHPSGRRSRAQRPARTRGCRQQAARQFLDHPEPDTPEEAATSPPWMQGTTLPNAGPEALFDVKEARESAGVETASLDREIEALARGGMAKVCFRVEQRKAWWLPDETRPLTTDFVGEAIWVRVTSRKGKGLKAVYRGTVANIPALLHPDDLLYGSPVTFSACHVHSVRPADDPSEDAA